MEAKSEELLGSGDPGVRSLDPLCRPLCRPVRKPGRGGKGSRPGSGTAGDDTIHWWEASWAKSNIDYFMRNKHKIQLEKLLKQCFEKKVIINNKFLRIEKFHQKYSIEIDIYYAFRFKYKYYNEKKFLTLFILGIQIPVWRTK